MATENLDLKTMHVNVSYSDECHENVHGGAASFVLFTLAIVLVGLFGNVLTILVLKRKNLISLNSVLLIILAVTDSLILLSQVAIQIADSIGYHLNSPRLHHTGLGLLRFFHFLGNLLVFLSHYLIMLALLERLMALCCAKENKVRWLLISIVGVVFLLLAVITNAPLLASLDIAVDQFCPVDSFGYFMLVPSELGRNHVYHWFESARPLLLHLLPMVFCLIASVPVIASSDYGTRLRTTHSRRFKDTSGRSAVIGVLCATASVVSLSLSTIEMLDAGYLMGHPQLYSFIADGTNVLQTSFSAVKFFVYCFAGELFRDEVRALFRCGRQHQYSLAPNNDY